MDFHKFYQAVAEAKIGYLNIAGKRETVPNFVEINCDTVGSDDEIAFVKTETSIGVTSNVNHTSQSPDDFGSASFFAFDNEDNNVNHSESDESSTKFEEEHDRNVDEAAKIAAAELAVDIVAKLEDSSDVPINSNQAMNKRFDHLISKYMDMYCEICRHPFNTLSEASSHYRSQHQRRTVTLKCCQRRINMPDIRDHIKYHLNSNAFK